ncbi:hypothetical protein B0H19DRAFT_1257214 [Mycena capillaripes]|nr:hypothetical protein B0H19DRAFT_1257214 [Mycena capillaripes]
MSVAVRSNVAPTPAQPIGKFLSATSSTAATPYDSAHEEYPFTATQLESIARAGGGKRLVDDFKALQNNVHNAAWRGSHVIFGTASRHHVDVHIRAVTNDYSVVFWGGPSLEPSGLWNFHISRARPPRITGAEYKEDWDGPVDLAAEHLRVLVDGEPRIDANQFEYEFTYIELREGVLGMLEGGTVHLEHSPPGGVCTMNPITFPIRPPKPMRPREVVLQI